MENLQNPPRIRYIVMIAFSVLAIGTVFYHFVEGWTWLDAIWFCVVTLATVGYEMFIMMFPQYDPIAAKSRIYTLVYPFIELLLGFLYVSNLLPVFRDLVTLVIFGIGAYGVLQYIGKNKDQSIRCACLGNVIRLPLSTVTLIEDVLMAGLSVIMLIGYLIF